jgi:hypothetical protein
MLDVNEHQMPDNPNTRMKMIKARANPMSTASNERFQFLNQKFLEIMLKLIMNKLMQNIYLSQNSESILLLK